MSAELSRRGFLALTAAAFLGASDRMKTMRAAPIPGTKESLPVIGLGTWQTFDVADAKPLGAVLSRFVARGGKLIDSSPMYGRAEGVVGELAAGLELRPSLFLATKVWTTGREAGIAQMDRSAAELRSPRIDLMQVHNLVDAATHLRTLRAWKEEGRVRYIGVTHYDADAYPRVEQLLRRERVDFLQINYSLAERE